MNNIKITIHYLSESEKILNDILSKNQIDRSIRSYIIIEKCCEMLRIFLNTIMEDEFKMMNKYDELTSAEIHLEGVSFFYNIMKEAEAIYEKIKQNLEDEMLLDDLSNSIIALRLNYLSLKSSYPHIF